MRIRFLMDTVLCFATSLLVASQILSLPSAEVSFGEVVAGDVGERVVELGNSGDAALHVSKVRACCGASAVLEMVVDNPRRPRVGVAYLSQRSCGDSPHLVSLPERRASVSEARLRLSAVSI